MFQNREKFYIKTLNAYAFQLTVIDGAGKSRVLIDPAPQEVSDALHALTLDRKTEFFLESGAPTDGMIRLCATDHDPADGSVYAVIQCTDPQPRLYGTRLPLTAFADLTERFLARTPLSSEGWKIVEEI